MAIPIPVRLDGMLAKVEGSYGVDASPVVGTDGVRISQRFWNQLTPSYAWENLRLDAATGTIFPAAAAVPRGSMASLDILCEVKGPGVAYSASIKPEVDPLLQACGWLSTGSFTGGSEKFTYTLLASSHPSATIYGYAGGMVFKILGARGTMNWLMRAGEIGAMRFQMQGILSSISALAVPTITSYDATSPVASVNMGISLGTYDPDWTTAEFVQGANMARFDSGNAADGIAQFNWTLVQPVFNITVRAPDDGTGKFDTANFNPYADATARTSRAIDATQGSAQYNRAKLSIASTYVVMPTHSEDNQSAALNLSYTSTDSAMTVIFD